MLSKIQAATQLNRFILQQHLLNNITSKRWSGHNNMNIHPSNFGLNHVKNMLHLYFMLGIIPIAVITTICNIRANPELAEIPEGYEPLPHEYHKQPLARWMAKYLYRPNELEMEVHLAKQEKVSEEQLLRQITLRVEKVMSFYNDHRSKFFTPFYGEYFRIGRNEFHYNVPLTTTEDSQYIDSAYDPSVNPLPTEGYRPTSEI